MFENILLWQSLASIVVVVVVYKTVYSLEYLVFFVGWELAQMAKAKGCEPCYTGMNPVTAITFSSAAIHFLDVYNLSSNSKANSSHTMVWEVKDPLTW